MKIMEKYTNITIIITLFFFNRYAVANEAVSTTKLYIVYMGEHSYPDSDSVISSNHELLASVAGSFGQAKEAITHHYHKSFRGFSAKLTPEQAQKLRETESVISVFESKTNQLHTTHSWDFLGVNNVPQNNAKVESKSDTIVGVIDTGIWPESESFNDNGLGPVPKRFKGECVAGDQFTVNNCNRKIIGARIYPKGYEAKYGPLESFNATFFRRRCKRGLQYVIPTTVLDRNEVQVLQNYVSRSKNPTAKISPTKTILNATRAPKMAFFSSIGPNTITPDIIKPDITAPGVRILAAWSPVSIESTAGRSVDYNIISGTSMSCPHASGIAAMVKSHHPSWSPAAIKSAIMTTANAMDNTKRAILQNPSDSPASPFNYGSGHVNPIAALDPGLVYDFGSKDLIDFLCSTRAYATQIQMLTGKKVACKSPPVPMYDLNYPSIGVANMNGSVTIVRTVTYYGHGPAVFDSKVELDSPTGVKVKATVKPKQLKFKEAGEKMIFSVSFVADKTNHGSLVFGSLTWSSGNKYKVRSPIGLNLASAIQVRGK
ncbi:hypothetical protein C5167_000405 [Papaver somniferum]|uniref:Uncharacterized protein n=1 Tax=Papaver somniferum TaxID=3469 RepID=A0A4Y7KTU9_PAPSO|nr:hypothetical protein C5167_000405 [Papaver somniferum]